MAQVNEISFTLQHDASFNSNPSNMIACVDVDYKTEQANAACIVIDHIESFVPVRWGYNAQHGLGFQGLPGFHAIVPALSFSGSQAVT